MEVKKHTKDTRIGRDRIEGITAYAGGGISIRTEESVSSGDYATVYLTSADVHRIIEHIAVVDAEALASMLPESVRDIVEGVAS